VCIHRRSIHIRPYTHSYMRMHAGARARIGGAAARNGRACVGDRPSAVRRGCKLGCRGSSMALEHMCASKGNPSTYALICIATCARTRAHTCIGGAAARNGRARVGDRPSAVRRGARRAESGAYEGQRRDGGGVPRADVRVEGRRRLERLRAENATLSEHTYRDIYLVTQLCTTLARNIDRFS
jgi:hypothetical protein